MAAVRLCSRVLLLFSLLVTRIFASGSAVPPNGSHVTTKPSSIDGSGIYSGSQPRGELFQSGFSDLAILSVVYHVRASIKLPGLRVKRLSHHAIMNWLPSGHLYIQSDILLCGDVKSQPGPSSRSDSRHGLFGLEDKSSVSNANTSLNLKLSSVGPSSKLYTPSVSIRTFVV